uniref:Uncharacterized protein n=1 Tax=Graphocephala atropunctata TaxID=36148 RepID=A0A1B6L649_9HEMI
MADGNGKINTSIIMKNKEKSKMGFNFIYEQLQVEHSALSENKEFWIQKGNSQKYTCTLCNISIQISSNINVVKTALVKHIEGKYHRKRLDMHMSKINTGGKDGEQEKINKPKIIDKHTLSRTFEYIDVTQKLDCFKKAYDKLEKSNPVTEYSKKYIKEGEGIHYYCELCNVSIFNSSNPNKLKYNIWVHTNSEDHREKLPNFPEIQNDFDRIIKNLFKTVPNNLRDDLKYFELGPVFRYIKCTLCQTAVSVNRHRFKNHIIGPDHLENKKIISKGGEALKDKPMSERTRKAFMNLVVKIEYDFRKDIQYIQIGKIPGYVVCILCSYVVQPTKFYVQNHFKAQIHVKNRANNLALKTTMKVSLKDLMSTLPDDLKDYNKFEENVCGLTCLRCNESLPATSYDLYSHIIKERHRYS